MNKNSLVAKMKYHGDTQEELAQAMGIALATLNMKINETNNAQFTQSEISFIRNRYHLTAEEVDEIFFSDESTL